MQQQLSTGSLYNGMPMVYTHVSARTDDVREDFKHLHGP